MKIRALHILVASILGAPVIAANPGSAHADGISVSVGGRVSVGGSVSVRVGGPRHVRRPPRHRQRPRHRVRVRPRVVVGGGIYVRTFAPPPPPPHIVDCGSCGPVYHAPPPPTVAVVTSPPPRHYARLGLGIMGGHYVEESGRDADELGLFGRLRVSRRWQVELEASKAKHDDGSRLDKRLGAGLVLDLSPSSTISPYLVGAVGAGRIDAGVYDADSHYGEVGAGLTWRISPRVHLAGDLRWGETSMDDEVAPVASAAGPGTTSGDPLAPNEYSRGRVSAILYF